MKILYHHRVASKDGQAVHIEEMIAALRSLSHEVIIVAPPGWSATNFGGGGGATAALRRLLPKAISELLELSYNWFAYRRLADAIRTHKPDALYERHNLYLLAGSWIRRRFGIPYFLEVNAPMYLERSQHGGLGIPSLASRSEIHVWKSADFVLPVTAELATIIERCGVPNERIRVIPNGINLDAFDTVPSIEEAKRRLGCEGRLVLGFTGFVRTWHGLDRVIDFIAESPRSELVLLVVGDGPARSELVSQAARLSVSDRVRFTGIVPREKIPECVAAFDVALQPAATSYASPLKLFEYLALGKAIVAPRQPNLSEVIRDGENGLLFEPGDRVSLFRVLEQVIGDPELRNHLGNSARLTIGQNDMTWTGNAKRVTALIDGFTAESKS